MQAIVRHRDGHIAVLNNVVVAVDSASGGVRAGISTHSTKPTLECYMAARVAHDTWLAVFSQPAMNKSPMHAPDLPFPLCLALLPDADCVCVAFRCDATAAAYCHWPPGIVLEWLHLGMSQWEFACAQLQRAARTQPLDAWLATTFDSQWMLAPPQVLEPGQYSDIPPCRDTPAVLSLSSLQFTSPSASEDPCTSVYDILASASVRTDVTVNSHGGSAKQKHGGRASAPTKRRAAAVVMTSVIETEPQHVESSTDTDDDMLTHEVGHTDDEVEDEYNEDDAYESSAESDDCDVGEEDLVLPDVVVHEDKEDEDDEDDESLFDEDASSDTGMSE